MLSLSYFQEEGAAIFQYCQEEGTAIFQSHLETSEVEKFQPLVSVKVWCVFFFLKKPCSGITAPIIAYLAAS